MDINNIGASLRAFKFFFFFLVTDNRHLLPTSNLKIVSVSLSVTQAAHIQTSINFLIQEKKLFKLLKS